MSTTRYLFDSTTDLGGEQLSLLEHLLDDFTRSVLKGVDLQPGQTCLDLGAGGGSVARMLADQVGPTGKVVAMDIATDRLVAAPGVEVVQHDINDGLPSRLSHGFDVIHARLLMMHLPQREAILDALLNALAPGGWLVLAELSNPYRRVIQAPSTADELLFRRIQDLGHHTIARAAGASWEWAEAMDSCFRHAGLLHVSTAELTQTASGGSPACLLNRNYIRQAGSLLLDAGATQEQLDRYCELMLDPDFRVWFYRFVYTSGQRAPLDESASDQSASDQSAVSSA